MQDNNEVKENKIENPPLELEKEKIDEPNKEIKILGILCNWCSYAGADLAGTSRFQYSPTLRVVRVMCSGRVDPELILEGFKNGVDGILIGGCHLGDCHYIDGNYHAKHKILYLQSILEKIGIDNRRLKLEWISAAEGKRFSEVVNDFSAEIKKLGKFKLTEEKKELLNSLIEVFTDFRVRWLIGNKLKVTEIGNVYGKKLTEEDYVKLLNETVDAELLRKRILKTIEKEPHTAVEISKKLNVSSEEIMSNLTTLLSDRIVAMNIKHHDAYFVKEEA